MDGQTCDRCPARAAARLDLDTGGNLYFCSHHLVKYFPESVPLAGMTFAYEPVKTGRRKWWRG